MPSPALKSWNGDRQERLNELFMVHQKVGGVIAGGPGRRRNTEQLNWLVIVKVSAEFQGFARELHDLCAEQFSWWVSAKNGHVRHTIRTTLVRGRKLNTGNATKTNLAADFSRFGIRFWPKLRELDSRSESRASLLDDLQHARNAIAHDDQNAFQQLKNNGYSLGLADARQWHRAVKGLATTMDEAMSRHLASLFAQAYPW